MTLGTRVRFPPSPKVRNLHHYGADRFWVVVQGNLRIEEMGVSEHFFSISSYDGCARVGVLHLPMGPVETPVFMPVGTVGALKAMSHQQLETLGYRLILGNTYHLYLRPGVEFLKQVGGLRKFSTWGYNLLTDSGGYQFFSLAPFRKFTNDGVKFRSHLDGSYHFFTPEQVIDIQEIIGSDIYMPLDQCTPSGLSEKEAYRSTLATVDWAKRSYHYWTHKSYSGKLFGIVQGNFYKNLRKMCVDELCQLDFSGYSIGGLAVGEEKPVFQEFVAFVTSLLPKEKPCYVMGIGTPDYILESVESGVDMFDCVYPSRVARNGSAMTFGGLLTLKSQRFSTDFLPLDQDCPCHACQRYSRAYIRHLVRAQEINAMTLLTEHNLTFMARFLEKIREAIRYKTFSTFKNTFLNCYYAS